MHLYIPVSKRRLFVSKLIFVCVHIFLPHSYGFHKMSKVIAIEK